MVAREDDIGNCFNCGSTKAEVICVEEDSFDDGYMTGATKYYILKCRGCDARYFKILSWNSEDYSFLENQITGELEIVGNKEITYWPPPQKRRRPEWAFEYGSLDEVLRSLLNDVYIALNNDLGVLAAIGIRTVFDRASQLHGIDPNQPFKEKLINLKIGGFITFKDEQFLEVLIDAGSAAAHRGWRPDTAELDIMMDILEMFLHRTFIMGDISSELRARVPQRAKKDSR